MLTTATPFTPSSALVKALHSGCSVGSPPVTLTTIGPASRTKASTSWNVSSVMCLPLGTDSCMQCLHPM